VRICISAMKREALCARKYRRLDDLPGGALFKVRHIALDGEVLALREAKEQEKTDEQDQVVKNAID
jgi:hypothetical protein